MPQAKTMQPMKKRLYFLKIKIVIIQSLIKNFIINLKLIDARGFTTKDKIGILVSSAAIKLAEH